MRFDRQKAFPYPVLRSDIDDYTDGEFQVHIDITPKQKQIVVEAHVALSVKEILREVEKGRAKIALVFSCRETYFREAVTSESLKFKHVFNNPGNFKGEVIIYPFVVARQEIKKFSCVDINPEFKNEEFAFGLGEVLAAHEPQVFFFERELFRPISSIVQIVKGSADKGFEWKLQLSKDKIIIEVSAEAKAFLDTYRNSTSNKSVLLNSLYFSAIAGAVQRIKDDSEECGDLRWAQLITQLCHNEGIDLEIMDAYQVVQRLMRNPLNLLAAHSKGTA
jgi:hypothetical protein